VRIFIFVMDAFPSFTTITALYKSVNKSAA